MHLRILIFAEEELIRLVKRMLIGSMLDQMVLRRSTIREKLIEDISNVIGRYLENNEYIVATVARKLPLLGKTISAESIAEMFGEDFIDESWNGYQQSNSITNWKTYLLSVLLYQKHCCDSGTYFDFKFISKLQASIPRRYDMVELNSLLIQNQNTGREVRGLCEPE